MRLAEMSLMREPLVFESSIILSNAHRFLILFSRSLSVRLPLVGVLFVPTSVRPWPKFTIRDSTPSYGRLRVGSSEAWRSRGGNLAVVGIEFELYSERLFMGAVFGETGGYFYAPDAYGPFKEGAAGEIGIALGGMPLS
jgi:hypothetical protein